MEANTTGEGDSLPIIGVGDIKLMIGDELLVLKDVRHAPSSRVNLISSTCLDELGLKQTIHKSLYSVSKPNEKLLFTARMTEGFYVIHGTPVTAY